MSGSEETHSMPSGDQKQRALPRASVETESWDFSRGVSIASLMLCLPEHTSCCSSLAQNFIQKKNKPCPHAALLWAFCTAVCGRRLPPQCPFSFLTLWAVPFPPCLVGRSHVTLERDIESQVSPETLRVPKNVYVCVYIFLLVFVFPVLFLCGWSQSLQKKRHPSRFT